LVPYPPPGIVPLLINIPGKNPSTSLILSVFLQHLTLNCYLPATPLSQLLLAMSSIMLQAGICIPSEVLPAFHAAAPFSYSALP
jgi:hypothetical protein